MLATNTQSYSLTKAQKRVWFNLKSAEKPLPNIVMVFELTGELDSWVLRKALENVVEENTVLKSTIYSSADHLERIINPTILGNLEVIDLTTEKKTADIYWLLQNIAEINFNLTTGPLFQFHLIKADVNHYYFTILIHPIIIDRYSLKYLVSEISRHYNAILQQESQGTQTELFDFNQLVELEKEFYLSEKCRQGLMHWTHTLKNNQFYLDLPKQGYFTKEYIDSPFYEIFLNKTLTQQVKQFAELHNVELHVVLISAYQALLQRYTGNQNIIINYSSAVSYTDKKVFGCMENRLPLRVVLDDHIHFSALIKLTQQQLIYDRYYKEIQINDIVKSVRDKYDRHFPGSFSNTSFDLNYLPYGELQLTAVNVKLIPKFMKKFVRENLAVYYHDRGEEISLIADFDEHLDSTAVKNFMHHYEMLLTQCITHPQKSIANLQLLTPAEYQQMVVAWNETTLDYPQEVIYRLFEKQVAMTPDKVALIFGEQQLTYQQLNAQANQLAQAILKNFKDNQQNRFVGICLNRSLEMIVSMFAVLKTGAAYVPLDPQYPRERLTHILGETQISVILSEEKLLNKINFLAEDQRVVICVDKDAKIIAKESTANLNIEARLQDLAYVIYTSGSTGLPKGVMIEHRSVPNIAEGYRHYFKVGLQSRVLQFASMNFDAVIPEVFSSLIFGATVYVVSEEVRQSPELLVEFIEKNAITSAFLSPALLKILPRKFLPALEVLSFGGDVCDQETVDYWSKGRRFINGYGPTEVTVFSTFSILKPGDPANRIGKPLPNYQAYVLDAHLNPIPVGLIGELYMGGTGVGRGYVNRAELTAERFIKNPFGPGCLYKTGDLVRWLPDGNIEYIGRADFEVKIRSFRIQLSDIEHVLRQFPGITHVATKVWQKEGLEKAIAAYYVVKENTAVTIKELKEHIQKYLPEYMVPAFFVELDAMPISVINGKINKALLPDPYPKNQSGQIENKIELALQTIWAALFKIPEEIISSNADFFELGGHSLLATQLVSRIKNTLHIDVTVKQIFQNSQLKQLAKLLRESTTQLETQFAIHTAPLAELYPPSYSELRLWYFYKTMPESTTYNILFSMKFTANTHIIFLRKALINLFNEHEIFRTIFVEDNGEVYQQILPQVECDIPIIDCQDEVKIQQELSLERQHRFSLEVLPLFKCKLLCDANNEVTLLFNIHHILFDGWSLEIFMRELGKHYLALAHGKKIENKAVFTYKDFAYSQTMWKSQNQFDQQLSFWQRKLFNLPSSLDLPTDFKRPKELSYQGDAVAVHLPEALVRAAKKLASSNKTSLFSLFLSVYYILLHKLTGQADLIVASPIANRNHEAFEQVIGLFANVSVYRAQLPKQMIFDEFLKQVHDDVVAAQENQDLPFDLLVNKILTERDTSRNPIFQTMFVLQNGFRLNSKWDECDIGYQIVEEHTKTAKFDLTLILNDNSNKDKISGYLEFNSELFKRETIERFQQYFLNVLRAVLENTQSVIENISLLSPQELKTIVYDWNQTAVDYPRGTINERFEQQVLQTPNNIAVVFQNEKLTYAELNARVNQLARFLRARYELMTGKALASDTFIGISLSRGIDMLVGLLAVIKAGAAYIPLDPNYPADRLNYILQDSAIKIVLTESSIIEKSDFLKNNTVNLICLDKASAAILAESSDNLAVPVKPTDLAYSIYTSGSTGVPKGVMLEHKGVVNIAASYRDYFQVDANGRVLEYASINFDAAIPEIFTPLFCGASVYILSDDLRYSAEELLNYLQSQCISMAVLPPALLRILPQRALPDLKTLAFAGDICDQDTVNYWAQGRRFINAYGPTEVTVCSTWSVIAPGDPVNRIGKPLPNYQVYVLDSELNPVPMGVLGELYIGGMGLARGYINRPDLSVEKFIVNPFSDNSATRMYKTGDLVRWLPEGELEYIGRSDFQAQIRGFRVELGEVEAVIGQHAAVKQAAVAIQGSGETKRLIAYFTEHSAVEMAELQQFVQKKLPDYMVPSAFIKIEVMPLSPTGKIDKKNLPAFDESSLLQAQYVAPRDAIEMQLVKLWDNLFNQATKIGVQDNFFNFGGNSLLAIRMLAQVKAAFNIEVRLAQFFQHPTIAGLADQLKGQAKTVDVMATAIADANQIILKEKIIYPAASAPKNILLTGTNGFLGIHLLQSLLQHTQANIYCLVRGKDTADIHKKMAASVKKFAAPLDLENPRLHFIKGDLALEKLGISTVEWNFLANTIDTIYHNGAQVNHLYGYELLKASNVGSTIELIKLASLGQAKFFNYISTANAISQFDAEGIALEAGPADKPSSDQGYILTKWVSEVLLWRAAAMGLKVIIYRPGNITGHSKTGMTQFENNHALLFIKSCIQLGVAPRWQTEIEMMPVDLLGDIITKLSLNTTESPAVFNLSNPYGLHWEKYFSLVTELGFALKTIPASDWCDNYIKHINEDNALYPLKSLYLDSPPLRQQGPLFKFKSDKVRQKVDEMGCQYLEDYPTQVKVYMEFLAKSGFIRYTDPRTHDLC